LPGLNYSEPFFPGANYAPAVPTPDAILGFPVGTRAATPAQIEAVMKGLAAGSPRCRLFEYGRSHEGRPLHYLVIASETNLRRLDALKADYAKLADPRKAAKTDVDRLAASLPALAWMAYVIHGNETSGSDAALAVAHHLAAGSDAGVKALLEELVVIIDPLMNPDGRDRHVLGLAQNRSAQPSVDDQSVQHVGVWPPGRTNHYLFDLNRDWAVASQPETRGRIRAINEWNPHYFVEGHEMSSQSTFAFYPASEAVNLNFPANVQKWEARFADDLSAAFDRRGWRYFNGEQYDNWYPGYSSSWAALRGIVDNLYEQAHISVDAVRRPEGTLESYREAVHKQLVASMANLATLARNRREVLADFVAEKRQCVGPDATVPAHTFVIVPSANFTRQRQFIDLLQLQGFEVLAAGSAFQASGRDRLDREVKDRSFPAGTLLISTRQPLARLVLALLEFDPRMTPQFLNDERRELLRFNRSLIYDVTGWSLPMLFDVEAYTLAGEPPVAAQATLATALPASAEPLTNAASPVAFAIDGTDDASVVAAGRLMERGVWLRLAEKPFTFGGKTFPRASVLITRKDNQNFPGDLTTTLRDVCAELKITALGVTTGFGPGELPDLGGTHFKLLQPPRIALLGREPFGASSYGECWYVLDHVLGLRATYLDFNRITNADLRRYNVLILPEGNAEALGSKIDILKTWVQEGGTLIALGNAVGAIAKDPGGIGSIRLLPATFAKPEPYFQAVIREWEGTTTTVEPDKIWAFTAPTGDSAAKIPWHGAALKLDKDDRPSEEELKRRDEWRRIFMPRGAVVAGRVDDRSWLTAGCRNYVPVVYSGNNILMVPPGAQAPVRLGYFNTAPAAPPAPPPAPAPEPRKDDAKKEEPKKPEKLPPGWTVAPPGHELRLRMSGLLWPEAAERIANSAYVAREGIRSGQIILFSSSPIFRAGALGTTRLFSNAVVYGPGAGASQPNRP